MRRCAAILSGTVEFITPKPEGPIASKEFSCIPPSLLYRRLLKLYIRKFDTDHRTIVEAWKQTKFEFWCHRHASPEEAALHNIRGQQIYEGIRAGLIPMYQKGNSGDVFFKYDSDTLKAAHNHIDPVDFEEFVRRYHDKIRPEDVEEVKATLKKLGRWKGPDHLSDSDLHRLKHRVKRKIKCTDPDTP
uniref:Uncharacterized protein TCIL3000_11_16150 n=1 Tax=Trypanosoma congolense (strain IL3000) TaxID=1068625 RepID=G0V382_TRYCI|nr:unnamed protein product [Trypanosoma congolense IL3000]